MGNWLWSLSVCAYISKEFQLPNLTTMCRVRYWTDGLVIGTSLFVRVILPRFFGVEGVEGEGIYAHNVTHFFS